MESVVDFKCLISKRISWTEVLKWSLLIVLVKNFPAAAGNSAQCQKTADCEYLNYTSCLGTSLPYQLTTTELASDSSSQDEIYEKLSLWSGLRNVPQCWAVVQPFLCAVYMPRCNESTNMVDLPTKEMCEVTRGPCKVVASTRGWPAFLQCDHEIYAEGCSNEVSKLQFNTTASCEKPLVATSNVESWYDNVEGCGLQCQNPLFTDREHEQVHTFIAVCGAICLICTFFTLITFIIDWKNANRYPALIIFFINACFFVGSIGWLAQFIPGARQDIVCRSDDTMRQGEPKLGSSETASCTIVFLIVYFPMMAGVTWFVILAYAWNLSFGTLGTQRDKIGGKIAYFHICAWCLPLVLCIICLAISEIDGDSLSGICFVGYVNHLVRGLLVLGPIGASILVGLVFLSMGLRTLCKVRHASPDLLSMRASAKIKETIFRIGIFALFALVFAIVTFSVHLYIFTNEGAWKKSFEEYVICEANVTIAKSIHNQTFSCTMENRPSLAALQLHIFSFFAAGIVMSSWVWNKSTIEVWVRFYRRVCKKPDPKPQKLKKHRMIAHAFSKRTNMNGGRVSISFASTHDDPLGMKLELNSMTSNDMSSAWMQAMPKLVRRRGGMMAPTAGTLRRYSDSDIQSVKSFRRMSIESHMSDKDKEKESRKKKQKKKKKHRRSKVGIAPVAFTQRNTSARQGLSNRQGSKHSGKLNGTKRRPSNGSVISNASAQSIRLSLERQGSVSSMSIDYGRVALQAPSAAQLQHLNAVAAMFTATSCMPGVADSQDYVSQGEDQASHPVPSSFKGHDGPMGLGQDIEWGDMEQSMLSHRRLAHRRVTYPTEADITVVQISDESEDSS